MHRRAWTAISAMASTALVLAASAVTPASAVVLSSARGAASGATPEVRVDQAGYPTGAAKEAYVMLGAPVAGGVSFSVVSATGVVLRGVSRDDAGAWNARYRAVYELNFSPVHRAGTYRIRVGSAVSAPFAIAPAAALYQRLVGNGVRYFTSERDGADVTRSVLDRQPANLTDASANVYATPKYDRNDNLIGGLTKTGGPVNVSGGWFDAGGGYEKFGYTASYVDALLLMDARDLRGPQSAALRSEAEFGLSWMRKLWNPAKKVMYVQVGIGNGNAKINGDYDFWFLPQAEDRLDAKPGDSDYYVEYRPVFEAAAPGQRVSPDLAGRYAADYALGAQLAAGAGPADKPADKPAGLSTALRLLGLARSVYALAQTTNVRSIVTAFPHDYYPGTEWKSDMLWGAAEIALADERLGVPCVQLRRDLAVAARWARAYIAQGHQAGGDTLNLYDNGAVAEGELLRAMGCGTGSLPHCDPADTVIAPKSLLGDLAKQLRLGQQAAHGDAFGLGTALGASDASPHAFGLYVTDALYQEYGGAAAAPYASFARQQLNYPLGANPWGASFVVGAGTDFPHCMQSEIANLAGSLTGSGAIQLGATVDGPSNPSNFAGLGTVSGMRACGYGSYGGFGNSSAAYRDNVVSWPSVEPADDYSAISLLAFSYGAAGLG